MYDTVDLREYPNSEADSAKICIFYQEASTCIKLTIEGKKFYIWDLYEVALVKFSCWSLLVCVRNNKGLPYFVEGVYIAFQILLCKHGIKGTCQRSES